MRHFQVCSIEIEASDFTRYQSEGLRIIFFGMIERYLQAEAYAKHRPAGRDYLFQCLIEATRAQAFHGTARRANTWKDDPLGTTQPIRIRTDDRVHTDFAASALNAAQIARVVVNDVRLHRICPAKKDRGY
jgi:hypothetical protein